MGWIDVEERLPEPYKVVLAAAGALTTATLVVKPAHQKGSLGWRTWPLDDGETPWLGVTHWMPLPPPPG